jgi:hypothetical protein
VGSTCGPPSLARSVGTATRIARTTLPARMGVSAARPWSLARRRAGRAREGTRRSRSPPA